MTAMLAKIRTGDVQLKKVNTVSYIYSLIYHAIHSNVYLSLHVLYIHQRIHRRRNKVNYHNAFFCDSVLRGVVSPQLRTRWLP